MLHRGYFCLLYQRINSWWIRSLLEEVVGENAFAARKKSKTTKLQKTQNFWTSSQMPFIHKIRVNRWLGSTLQRTLQLFPFSCYSSTGMKEILENFPENKKMKIGAVLKRKLETAKLKTISKLELFIESKWLRFPAKSAPIWRKHGHVRRP